MVGAMEQANAELKEQIEKLEIDNRKQQESVKGYLEVIKNKKRVEEELLDTIREIKEKAEKKEWEERMEKLKLQFDKAAVESKKNINKLQEENTKANGMIEEIRTDLEKKQVECRTLTN